MELNFTSFNDDSITMRISEGVYYFNDIPMYIVERIEEQEHDYVIVYNVNDPKEPEPRKKFKMQTSLKTIPGGTALSDYIKKRLPNKAITKYVDEEPLFIADVINNGIDTVTGHYGRGFFERQPDKSSVTEKGIKVTAGDYTGIFIGLESIKWRKSYTPLDSVVQYYKQQKENRYDRY